MATPKEDLDGATPGYLMYWAAPMVGFWRLAEADPDWTAAVEPDGTSHQAGAILGQANRIVHCLRSLGFQRADCLAALLPNGAAALEMYLAALQAGWYLTPINWHLTPPEIANILRHSEARAFVVHERYASLGTAAADLADIPKRMRLAYGSITGFRPLEEVLAGHPRSAPANRTAGRPLFYTSGSTGRPKAVRRPLAQCDPNESMAGVKFVHQMLGMPLGQPNAHLVTSPHYHTAVTQFAAIALHGGHTLVYMDRFDPEDTLRQIENCRITSSHMVPTQFKRLLALPAEVRIRYDLSSMKWLIHGAAPCPIQIKRAMLEWWGPCIYEYYSATEGGGALATPEDWLKHPGTVGKPWPVSEIRVLDDDGRTCPPGLPGLIYLKMAGEFEYKDDPATTAANRRDGFFTVGDVGYFDDEGYLFLCGRQSDVIISGGVNLYPPEIEAELTMHPSVADVAVIGVPDDEWGEQVKAIVQLVEGVCPDLRVAEDIVASLEGRLAKMKWPKSVDFVEEIPRDPNGKLLKAKLREPYLAG